MPKAAEGTLCDVCRSELAEDYALHHDTPPGRCGGGDLPDDPLLYFEQRREEILAFC